MKKMTYLELEKHISSNRLSTYKSNANESHVQTLTTYFWNTRLSENFYLLLQNLEVGLRNAIYDAFITRFPTQPFFFLNETDISKRYIKRREYHSYGCWKMIGKVKSNLNAEGIIPSDGKIIAELNFGFWTTLLKEKHYRQKFWHQLLRQTFPNYPFSKSLNDDIKNIAREIDSIRIFRNRIFHYEPIFNQNSLHNMHNSIIKVLGWLSPELQTLSIAFDDFDNIIRTKSKIYKKLNTLYPSTAKRRRLRSKGKKS